VRAAGRTEASRDQGVAPPIVHDTLRSPGRPLDPVVRAEAEYQLRHDLSDVRIHADERAAASARAVDALAYTVGQNVVFDTGRYAPRTGPGFRLLAHELAHVVQQRGASAPNPLVLASPQHPLERNAEQMVSMGAPAEQTSCALVQRQAVPSPLPPLTFPRPPRPRATLLPDLELRPRLLPGDRARILAFLARLSVGPGLTPVLAGRPTTLDAVVDSAAALVLPIIPREDVEAVVSAEWHRLVRRALTTPILPPPPITFSVSDLPRAPAHAADELQSAAGVQWTWHMSHPAPTDRTVQVQLTQGSGAAQRVYQFAVNLDSGDAQALAGAQVSTEPAVAHVLGAVVKANAFVQLLVGITTARGAASGDLTIQLQAGAQVTVTLGPVTVALQAAPTLTIQGGGSAAIDFGVAPQAGGTSLAPGNYPPFPGITLVRGTF
jgi:hypothetical protein